MDTDTRHHLQHMCSELDQTLAEARRLLLTLARDLHSVDREDLLPPERTWMISHLYHLDDGLKGAENHVVALGQRIEAYQELILNGED